MRNTIFVFGSNRAGIHGAGAAQHAYRHHGAEWGIGEGIRGESYALPTCSMPGVPLTLAEIAEHVRTFRAHVLSRQEMSFMVTAVGCGYAGFDPREIATLFHNMPDNVYFQARLAYGF